jgi:hypothetical protein
LYPVHTHLFLQSTGFLGKRGLAHPFPVVTAERALLNDREATQFILDPGITVAATPLAEQEELQQTDSVHTHICTPVDGGGEATQRGF